MFFLSCVYYCLYNYLEYKKIGLFTYYISNLNEGWGGMRKVEFPVSTRSIYQMEIPVCYCFIITILLSYFRSYECFTRSPTPLRN